MATETTQVAPNVQADPKAVPVRYSAKQRFQFCKHGHEVSILGRNGSGACIACRVGDIPKKNGGQTKRFCKRGHDTSITGRRPANKACLVCASGPAARAATLLCRWRNNGIKNLDGTQFSPIDFDRAYQVQQGKCKLCGIHQTQLSRRMHVDHDHATGFFRGLTCAECNVNKIGNNTLETAIALVEYLRGE